MFGGVPFTRMLVVIVAGAITEAITAQTDNLLVPLVMLIVALGLA